MANFSVIAKNDKLEQINNIDDLQYAFEMYKYLAIEMDFPDVKLIDNETGEVLLYVKRESTTYEYISPLLMKSFQEGGKNADTPIEPNGIDEETALKTECRDIIDSLLESTNVPTMIKEQLENIYNQLIVDAYSVERLQNLKKILKNLLEKY